MDILQNICLLRHVKSKFSPASTGFVMVFESFSYFKLQVHFNIKVPKIAFKEFAFKE